MDEKKKIEKKPIEKPVRKDVLIEVPEPMRVTSKIIVPGGK